jgi:hypothetical protein
VVKAERKLTTKWLWVQIPSWMLNDVSDCYYIGNKEINVTKWGTSKDNFQIMVNELLASF